MAAISREMAALHATFKHSGLFVSSRLERVRLDVGRAAVGSQTTGRPRNAVRDRPERESGRGLLGNPECVQLQLLKMRLWRLRH
ncbi:MAG: hypothetical protein L0Y66_18285 [Myxococcaceae bacterium]|nr:hypothetical protein [Myxococcaceae bacterium]